MSLEALEATLSGSGRPSISAEPLIALRGHTSSVVSIKVIDGSLLASGCEKGLLKIWDMEAGREIAPDIKAHDHSIQSISKINNNTIITSGRDATAKVWEIDDGGTPSPVLNIFTGCTHFCNSATLSNSNEENNIVCCPSGEENEIVMWDIRQRSDCQATVFNPGELHTGMVMSLLYRATVRNASQQLICGFERGNMAVYDVRSTRVLAIAQNHEHPLTSLDSSNHDDKIVSVGADELLIQSILQGEEDAEEQTVHTVNAIELPSIGGSSVKYRDDGSLIVSGRWDHTVRLFDAKRLKPLATLRFHRESVNAVEFIPEGPMKGYFASASKDGVIALWDNFAEPM